MGKHLKTHYQTLIHTSIILILIISTLNIISFQFTRLNEVQASSTWTQTTKTDFGQGTFENVTIKSNATRTILELDLLYPESWEQKTPSSTQARRTSHGMASIDGTSKVVVYGGGHGGQLYNDTSVYDLNDNRWVDMDPNGDVPDKRRDLEMAAILGTDNALLFGGQVGSGYDDETWIYDLSDNVWTLKNPNNKPGERICFAMAPIYGTKKTLLFGGFLDTWPNFNDETWVYDFTNEDWINMNPTGTKPVGRRFHALGSIYGTDKVLLFGGETSWGHYINDTWIYDLGDNIWIQVSPENVPCERFYHKMSSIYGTDKVLLVGGSDLNNEYEETWTYDFSDNAWVKKFPPGDLPRTTRNFAMAPIIGTGNVVLFGGYGNTQGNETWVYKFPPYTFPGTFISAPHDTGTKTYFKSLSWSAETPVDTSIQFQLRTAATKAELGTTAFVGPNGYTDSYYTSSPANVWFGHTNNQWVQYKALLSTDDEFKTPSLKEVVLNYNCLPSTEIISPENENITNNNKPIFEWSFNDMDSELQAAFQVIIDNDFNFESIDYDSGQRFTSNHIWTFPDATSYSELADGIWYWKVRTRDNDGDWGEYSSPRKIMVDTTAPVSTIIEPKNNGYYNNLNTIFGTSYDKKGDSGIDHVEITIKRLSDNYYWSGSSWLRAKTWLLADGKQNWSYDTNLFDWSSGIIYEIGSRALDLAKNIESPINKNTFFYDTIRPTSTIDFPIDNAFLNKLETISGTCSDTGGANLKSVQIGIQQFADNYYWNGIAWQYDVYLFNLSFDETGLWTFDAKNVPWATDTKYIITSYAIDNADNIELIGGRVTFLFDDQPPVDLSIMINEGDEYTKSHEVLFSLNSEDTGSGVAEMTFSTDGMTWSSWETYSSNKSFKLPEGDGEKNCYFNVRDRVKNTAEPVMETITLDTKPPYDLVLLIEDGATKTKSTIVALDISANDNTSGVDLMSFSTNGNNWSGWVPFASESAYSLTPEDGEKTVYLRVMDRAGNTATPITGKITLDTQSNDGSSGDDTDTAGLFESNVGILVVSSILIIIIIAIIIFLLLIRKKRQPETTTDRTITSSYRAPEPAAPILSPTTPTYQTYPPPSYPSQEYIHRRIPPKPPQTYPPIEYIQNVCPMCGQQTFFVSQNNRYYCNNCHRYI